MLEYYLLIKQSYYLKLRNFVNNISHTQLEHAATEIKSIGKCSNLAILSLEYQVQIVASRASNSFAKYAEQAVYIKALMMSNNMPVIWMTFNLNNLKSKLVLTLAGVCYKINNRAAAKIYAATATMNSVAIAQFFSTI